jgi:hypothetical protein
MNATCEPDDWIAQEARKCSKVFNTQFYRSIVLIMMIKALISYSLASTKPFYVPKLLACVGHKVPAVIHFHVSSFGVFHVSSFGVLCFSLIRKCPCLAWAGSRIVLRLLPFK